MKTPALFLAYLMLITFSGAINIYGQSSSPVKPFGEPEFIQDFLCSEVIYPEKELSEGIEGKVIISFTVEPDGQVSQFGLKENISPGLDAEAVRLFGMLLWEPATEFGNPVRSVGEFPVDFNIKKYKKHCKARGYERTELPFQPVDSSNIVYETGQTDRKPYPLFSEPGMSFNRFISQNISYPETAYRQGISGTVTLKFVIETSGRASNIKIINPVGGGCSQEAIRLLKLLRWMPGIKGQGAVRTFMKIDIGFKLPENSEMNMFENSQMNPN